MRDPHDQAADVDASQTLFVKLLDFGVAKMMHGDDAHLTQSGVILGTPYYMAPEQARGQAIDHRADIYSLGVMMYHAFTGRLPFVADSAVAVLTAHAIDIPAPPSSVSAVDPGIEQTILRCMEKSPDARFSSMTELAECLRSLRRSSGAFSMPPAPSGAYVRIDTQAGASLSGPYPSLSTLASRAAASPAPPSRAGMVVVVASVAMIALGGVAAFAVFARRPPDPTSAHPANESAVGSATGASAASPPASTGATPEASPTETASAVAPERAAGGVHARVGERRAGRFPAMWPAAGGRRTCRRPPSRRPQPPRRRPRTSAATSGALSNRLTSSSVLPTSFVLPGPSPHTWAFARRLASPLALALSWAAIGSVAMPRDAFAQTAIPASPAEAREQAKRLFDFGAAEYTQGNYEAAIDDWQKSYDLSREPLIYENLGNAYERLGKNKQARDALSKWRDVAPAAERGILDRRIQNLDKRIAREDADEAERQKRDADMKKKLGDQSPAAYDTGPDFSIPGVILVSAGGASVIIGVILDGVAAAKRPDADVVCKKSGTSSLCLASAKDDIATSSRLAGVGDAMWIIGGAAAATGVVLILTYPPAPPPRAPAPQPDSRPTTAPAPAKPHARAPNTPERVMLTPWGGPHGGGLVLQGALF